MRHSGIGSIVTLPANPGPTTLSDAYSVMFFRQLYDRSLAQASYIIGCQATGEAIVVDPLRTVAPYLDVAAEEGLRLTHVTETHIHADFVSGSRELHAATGAQLLLSAEGGTDWQYVWAASEDARLLHDGEHFMVGNIRFDVLHTPGHTPEHLSFVVTDTPRAAGPMGIITGDFVFVGDVGRPDLLEKAAKVANTMDAAARTLFRSLQRFRTLPDHLQVWPGHGAGSACGKALGAVPSTTVGYERLANWGVNTLDEREFVRMVLEGQPEPPKYFAEMKRINRDGPALLAGAVVARSLPAAAIVALAAPPNAHSTPTPSAGWIIDLRTADAFAEKHIPASLSLPYSRSFSTFLGSIVPIDAELVLLGDTRDEDHARDVVQRAMRDLSLIGFDRVRGWIPASAALDAWGDAGRAFAHISRCRPEELRAASAAAATVVDVRGQSEWNGGHVPGAVHLPLGELVERVGELPDGLLVVHCQSGARSAIATSLLQRLGRTDVVDLQGGFARWRHSGAGVEAVG